MSDDESLENNMKNAALGEVNKYIKSNEFQVHVKAKYEEQIVALIKRSEGKARLWAGVAAFLIVAVFFIMLSLEYVKIRERQADLYMQYAEATKLIEEVNKKVGSFKENINTEMVKIDKKIEDNKDRLSKLDTNLTKAETRLDQLKIEEKPVVQ